MVVGIYDLIAAIAAAGAGILALLVVRGRLGLRRIGARGQLVRSFGVAALSALLCAATNIIELATGGTVSAAVGNAANVFAPAMVWVGARSLNARRDVGAVTSGACALLMLAATFVLPLDDATQVKTGAVAAFAALAVVELRRGTVRTTPGSAIMSVTMAAYAVFNVARIVIATAAGTGSWVWNALASQQVTTVLSAVVLLSMSAAAVRMGRALDDTPEPGTREHARAVLRSDSEALLRSRAPLRGITLRVTEFDLIRAAHGTSGATTVVALLRDAAAAAVPDGSAGILSRDTVAVVVPDDERADVERAVRDRFSARLSAHGFGTTAELRVLSHPIADDAQLGAFLEVAPAGSLSPRWWGRSRSARTGTPSAG